MTAPPVDTHVSTNVDDKRCTVQAVADLYTALSACRLAPNAPVGAFLAHHQDALALVGGADAARLLWGWGLLGAPANVSVMLLTSLMRSVETTLREQDDAGMWFLTVLLHVRCTSLWLLSTWVSCAWCWFSLTDRIACTQRSRLMFLLV